ncbi:MAG: hypothetical protein AAF074_01170 [Pseudomonadota bacterium]
MRIFVGIAAVIGALVYLTQFHYQGAEPEFAGLSGGASVPAVSELPLDEAGPGPVEAFRMQKEAERAGARPEDWTGEVFGSPSGLVAKPGTGVHGSPVETFWLGDAVRRYDPRIALHTPSRMVSVPAAGCAVSPVREGERVMLVELDAPLPEMAVPLYAGGAGEVAITLASAATEKPDPTAALANALEGSGGEAPSVGALFQALPGQDDLLGALSRAPEPLPDLSPLQFGMVDVFVPQTDQPVLLVLAARHRTLWSLQLSRGANLGRVVVVGMAPQAVAHLPEGTGIAFLPGGGPEDEGCPPPPVPPVTTYSTLPEDGEGRFLQSAEHGAWRAWLTLTLDTPADFAAAASVAHLFPAGKPRDNMEYSTLAQATITVPAAGLYLWGDEEAVIEQVRARFDATATASAQ